MNSKHGERSRMRDTPAGAPSNNPISVSRHILQLRLAHDQDIARSLKGFWPVQQGSVLEQDDRALDGCALSALVYDLLETATHVSSSLQKLIVMETNEGTPVLPSLHGAYSLVRTHLEATSSALWLMAPQSRRARIRRCIQYWCTEVKLLNGFQTEWSKSFLMPKRICYEDLKEIATKVALPLEGFPGRTPWMLPGTGPILKFVEFAHENAGTTWFNFWQFCSGFAHSKQWASKIFTEQPTASNTEGTKSRAEALPVLPSIVHEAGLLLDEAAHRYGQLSTTSNAAWNHSAVF